MPTIPAASREYLYLPGIAAFDASSPDAAADPTALPVDVAFVASGTPADADWHAGEWANATTARILIGPPDLALPAGEYRIWLRVTGAVEQPERAVGTLRVST